MYLWKVTVDDPDYSFDSVVSAESDKRAHDIVVPLISVSDKTEWTIERIGNTWLEEGTILNVWQGQELDISWWTVSGVEV